MYPTHLEDYVKVVEGMAIQTQDGGSASAVTGSEIDASDYESCVLSVPTKYTNQQDTKDVTVSYTIEVLEATSSGGSYSTYKSLSGDDLNVVTTGVSDVSGSNTNEIGVNLRGAENYIKIKITPDDTAGTDNGSTGDTSYFGANVILGGAYTKPV